MFLVLLLLIYRWLRISGNDFEKIIIGPHVSRQVLLLACELLHNVPVSVVFHSYVAHLSFQVHQLTPLLIGGVFEFSYKVRYLLLEVRIYGLSFLIDSELQGSHL